MTEEHPAVTRLIVVLFTDIVESVKFKSIVGTSSYTRMLAQHDNMFRTAMGSCAGAELLQDTGDGFYARFDTVSDAVRTALKFQHALGTTDWGPHRLCARTAVNVGEVTEIPATDQAPRKFVGLAIDMAARL